MNFACNAVTCRKKLIACAIYVTRCSHMFCESCGEQSLEVQRTCLICHQSLPAAMDFLKVQTDPSEDAREMMLSGLTPDVIADVASRGLAFYAFQMNYEQVLNKRAISELSQRMSEKDIEIQDRDSQGRVEASRLMQSNQTQLNEISELKSELSALQERLADKSRQHQRLQSLYDAARRKQASNTETRPTSQSTQRSSPKAEHGTYSPLPLHAVPSKMKAFAQVSSPEFVTPAHGKNPTKSPTHRTKVPRVENEDFWTQDRDDLLTSTNDARKTQQNGSYKAKEEPMTPSSEAMKPDIFFEFEHQQAPKKTLSSIGQRLLSRKHEL